MSLTDAEASISNFLNARAAVCAIVHLTEYDLERKEPAHGAVEFHIPLFFKLVDFWNGGAEDSNTLRVAPENRKKVKLERGRAFVVQIFVRLCGGPVDRVYRLANQVDLFPHDATVLQLRSCGSLTNDDSLELLLDSEQCVAGVKYTLTPDKHKKTVLALISTTAHEMLFERFKHGA